MNVLIIKLGATGDVVRTTPLLRRLGGHVTWITAAKNVALLKGPHKNVRCLSWEERESACDTYHYDLAVNLEDTFEAARFLQTVQCSEIFGAYFDRNSLRYTENSADWFDLSLISVYGKQEADRRKFRNRRTYQEIIFDGLGFRFAGERYLLPEPIATGLSGDVALAADSGPVWPMKKWAYYAELKNALEAEGLLVNLLPERKSLLEHLCDVRSHKCLVGGDSLPMHFALGTETPCVSLFTCTSPWEIYGYGVQKKLVSPLLERFFYKREWNESATSAIGLEEVKGAVLTMLESARVSAP